MDERDIAKVTAVLINALQDENEALRSDLTRAREELAAGRANVEAGVDLLKSALSTTQAELAEARKVIEPFAKFSTHGFQGSVMEVCEPHPDNPSRRIEPFDAIHFRRASEFIRRVEGK